MRVILCDVGPRDGTPRTPPLVIIPGHTARIEGFDQMVPTLAERHRVLVLDMPGSGESAKPDIDYTLRLYEDTVIGFLDALGITAPLPSRNRKNLARGDGSSGS